MRIDEVGLVSNGFRLNQRRFVKDIDSEIDIYEHIKTKAKFVHIKNKEENKAFTIGFKTIPSDNTGVLHILEHTVLGGSKKYPVKEPIVELGKGSLNTYLNAMTYSDKTVYPVASKNEKDLFNMIKVYLDGVYSPNVLSNDKIFKQEGWHYHIEDVKDDIEYSGVVYNEMRGNAFTPVSILFDGILESLYPDTHYKYNSGGIPTNIVELTYDKFVNEYKKFYHPSNSYMCLYGDVNVSEILEYIDNEYLDKYDYSSADIKIEEQINTESLKDLELLCPSSGEDDNYIALNYSIGKSTDMELCIAMELLSFMLGCSEESPLKQAILDKELADEVFIVFNTDVLQPYFSIIAKGIDVKNKDLLVETVDSALFKIITDGLNENLIKGTLNIYEFKYKEAEYDGDPKAIKYSIEAISAMIYNGDVYDVFDINKYILKIKECSENRYFEDIISKYLIENKHKSILTVKQDDSYLENINEDIRLNLDKKKKTLSVDELEVLVEETLDLLEYQSKDDSELDLSKIPSLKISDINHVEPELNVGVYNVDGTEIIHHNINTNGIMYLTLMFDIRVLNKDELVYLQLLNLMMGRMGTLDKSYIDFSNEKMIELGDMVFKTKSYINVKSGNYSPNVECFIKVMSDNCDSAVKIIKDNIEKINFCDYKRIKEVIKEEISGLEMEFVMDGYSTAVSRLESYYSEYGQYVENISGINYYNFLNSINIDDKKSLVNLVEKLYEIKNKIFNSKYLKVSLIGDNLCLNNVKCYIKDIKASLSSYDIHLNKKYSFDKLHINEGILIPSDVNYVVKGHEFRSSGVKYSGHMNVLANIIENNYLWKNIRVKGGAYGAFIHITEDCNLICSSYRDPNIIDTLRIYDSIPEYISSLEISSKELERIIISSIADRELPDTPLGVGRRAINCYLNGKDLEYRQNIRDEILSTTVMDLRNYSDLFKYCFDKNTYSVVGGEFLESNVNIFDKIVRIF